MADFKVSGRLTVSGLQKQFSKEFGLELRVYKGKKFADGSSTLAKLSEKKIEDFTCKGNMKIGNFETNFAEATGLNVQVASIGTEGNEGKLIDNGLTLSQAVSQFGVK